MSQEISQQQDILTMAVEANASIAIQSGLALAQKAIQLEQEKNCEALAIDFFKKAIIILEQEIIYCKGQFQTVLQTLIFSYQNRCKSLSLQKQKRELIEMENHLETFDIMDPYSIYPIKKSDLLNIEGDSRFNPFLCYQQGANSQQISLETLLNVVEEFEKIEMNIKLLFTSMHQGVQLTKRLFITPLIWYMPIEETEILKEKQAVMHELGYNIEQILVMNKYSPSYEFFGSVKSLREYCQSVYKNKKYLIEENIQFLNPNKNSNSNPNSQNNQINGNIVNNNANSSSSNNISLLSNDQLGSNQQNTLQSKLNNKFDQYKNTFLKKFKKILKTENEEKQQIDYYHQFVIKIILNDLYVKYNQYISYSKKKQS
ncbi:hypothetical protein TTHERM_00041470 (macronuclear) [Tetrahymena thermophila SB210]|uniref:MIT domain protein n=1 Tax=Tetrahymena thermophila (strain SB210) TaxID=312017 RepID=Q22LX0_TETTS|nr:hypothetical protein TTHERM_00041470 [Tetrahymena thermophila SB210]EAR86566.2 hypothetical protein TTHERM_00041470 [Tetrahymena thermophila SB210]|eukprot:XP_977250.2 hypothetical protein TTHERM_00041470 [Tetrahymena thermophila SB210]